MGYARYGDSSHNLHHLGQQFCRFEFHHDHLHGERPSAGFQLHQRWKRTCPQPLPQSNDQPCHADHLLWWWFADVMQRLSFAPVGPDSQPELCHFRHAKRHVKLGTLQHHGNEHRRKRFGLNLRSGYRFWRIVDHHADQPRRRSQQHAHRHHHVVRARHQQLRVDVRCVQRLQRGEQCWYRGGFGHRHLGQR